MMIPLRRAFIVKQHGKLKYPEGTACADVLIVGEKGGATRQDGLRRLRHRVCLPVPHAGTEALAGVPAERSEWFKGAVAVDRSQPGAAGVGYIIGTRISCVMVAGGVLASFVLIPAIRLFGDGLDEPLFPGDEADPQR